MLFFEPSKAASLDISNSHSHNKNPNKGADLTEKDGMQISDSVTYKIVKKENISYSGTSRMVCRVVLISNKIPSLNMMKEIAIEIWKKGYKGWKEFTIFMYLLEMDTNNIAYGIANFIPSGMEEFKINDFALYNTKWWKK